MKLTTYILNLDRHPERLKATADQLDQQGIAWTRFQAIDAKTVEPDELDELVARKGPIPRMPDGARACTAGHMAILQEFLNSDASHALVLEDDIEISSEFADVVSSLLEALDSGLVNVSRQVSKRRDKKLIIDSGSELNFGLYSVRELVGVHYSCAGYVIDRASAKIILEMFPHPNMPIDHIMFNPNVSELGKRIKVRQLFPAIVRPREDLTSSIQTAKVEGSGSTLNKIKRARAEVSIVPRLLFGLVTKRYKVKTLVFQE